MYIISIIKKLTINNTADNGLNNPIKPKRKKKKKREIKITMRRRSGGDLTSILSKKYLMMI